MGTLLILIGAIETRMTALGFIRSDGIFNFDQVPSSIIHKNYRIETRLKGNAYDSGLLANPKDEVMIWIAYETRRIPRSMRDTALDDRETIEKDLVTSATILALASDPLLTMDGEASIDKEVEGYLISKLVFTADYLRSLA